MKGMPLSGLLLAAALAAGCELVATTDHGHVVVTDGAVSSLQTQQGNVIVDFHPDRQRRELDP